MPRLCSRLLFIVTLVFCLGAESDPDGRLYQPSEDPLSDVQQALGRAEKSDRLALVVVGANWCHDSRALASRLHRPPLAEVIQENYELVFVDVGFYEEPDRDYIELSIPDTSSPPFVNEKNDFGNQAGLTETLKSAVNTMTTKIVGLARGLSRYDDPDSSTDVVKAAQDLITESENHYYYEEKALQLNFSVCNTGEHPVNDLHVEFGFPKIEDFDIADRIHMSPFDKSSHPATRNQGYPDVEAGKKGFIVRNKIGVLEPAVPTPALKCPLRMAVGPGMQKRKIAVLYTLRRGDEVIGDGRLKIKFGEVVD